MKLWLICWLTPPAKKQKLDLQLLCLPLNFSFSVSDSWLTSVCLAPWQSVLVSAGHLSHQGQRGIKNGHSFQSTFMRSSPYSRDPGLFVISLCLLPVDFKHQTQRQLCRDCYSAPTIPRAGLFTDSDWTSPGEEPWLFGWRQISLQLHPGRLIAGIVGIMCLVLMATVVIPSLQYWNIKFFPDKII